MSRVSSASSIIEIFSEASYARYIVVFVAGALLALAFSPIDLYFLGILCPALLFYSILGNTPRAAAITGWWFGFGFFSAGVSWVFVAIYVFGNSSFFTSILLTVFSMGFLALYFSVQAYLSKLMVKKLRLDNEYIVLLAVFPLLWVVMEWFRGWFLTGFPWLSLGYSQTETVLSGYAPVIGVFGLSWLTALSSALFLIIILHKKYILPVTVISIIWFSGFLLTKVEWTEKSGDKIKVSLVQGNVDQKTKWIEEHFENRKKTYLSLTEKNWDSELILWPENSLTIFYHQLEKSVIDPLVLAAKKNKSDIILGLPVLDRDKNEYFSSLLTINGTTKKTEQEIQFYHKNHLVPFGEYLPLASLLRGVIAFFDLPMSGFTPGAYHQDHLFAAGEKIAPTICYEDAFGEDLIRFLPEATLILNASNNAWYGDSFAPHQHLQISQMRALETGRDVMRVTTNGVSALIDYKGSIISRSPQFETHVIKGEVQPRTGATPYVTFGNSIVISIIVVILTFLIIHSKTLSRSKF